MKNWFVKHWLPTLIALLIIILCFAISVEIFRLKEYRLAERIFEFLDSWAMVLSASVTLLLAIAAFIAIRQTRIIRAEEREADFKRKTLDGIVNWVIQINKDCVGPAGTGEKAYKEWIKGITLSMTGEGKWVLRNSNIFGAEFSGEVNNLVAKIMNLNEKIKEIGRSGKYSDKESLEMLSGCFLLVLEATDIVLDAALKIRSDQKL